MSGCGAGEHASSAGETLQREHLLVVSHGLEHAEAQVGAEVAATKAAWPLVANGLPAQTSKIPRSPIHAAGAAAATVKVPSVFDESQSAALSGPAAAIAGLFRSYSGLALHGWEMIGAAIDQIKQGSPQAARFARANVALYIESVYDGHFNVAQIGKRMLAAYRDLGGERVFGATLTQAEVDALARTYSEANDRLHPHPGVRLGS